MNSKDINIGDVLKCVRSSDSYFKVFNYIKGKSYKVIAKERTLHIEDIECCGDSFDDIKVVNDVKLLNYFILRNDRIRRLAKEHIG